jgi:iron complex outermembrane receptor protein
MGVQTQFMQNTHTGFEYLIPNFTTGQAGMYYLAEYRKSSKWLYMAGVRFDGLFHNISQHMQPVYVGGEPTGAYTERTPAMQRSFGNMSGSLGSAHNINKYWDFKMNLGSSFRMPTAVELGINGIHHGNYRHELGNPNLSTERGFQLDVELIYNHYPFGFSFSPFAAYYSDYIYLAPSGRFSPLPGSTTMWAYQQTNAVFFGGEWMSQVTLAKGITAGLGLDYVLNYNLNTYLPLPLTPPFMALINVEYSQNYKNKYVKRAYVFAETRWAADQNRVDRNERTTAGYQILELGFGSDFKLGKTNFSLFGRVHNLTNQYYMNHLSRYRLLNLPEPGRNFSISLKIFI